MRDARLSHFGILALLAACGGKAFVADSSNPDGGGTTDPGAGGSGGKGGQVACGPTVCSEGKVCCNVRCGICVAPNESCSDIVCGGGQGGFAGSGIGGSGLAGAGFGGLAGSGGGGFGGTGFGGFAGAAGGVGGGGFAGAAVGVCSDVTLDATDTTSLDYGPGQQTWHDDRVRAYSLDKLDITGWVRFDLSTIPDGQISGMRLLLHHEIGFGNPSGSPVVIVHYSGGNLWARATAGAIDIPRTRVVSGQTSSFKTGDWNVFAIDGAAADWAVDLADNWLTLGVTDLQPNAYVYFNGTDNPSVRPRLMFQICR